MPVTAMECSNRCATRWSSPPDGLVTTMTDAERITELVLNQECQGIGRRRMLRAVEIGNARTPVWPDYEQDH